LFVALWEVLCWALSVPEFVLPGPIGIATSMIEYREIVARHATQTFLTTMAGFSLGVAVGIILGAIVGSSRFAYKALYPLLVGFNAAPKSAFVPILVVWFGVGTLPAIITAFLICFFPITVNVATGLATLEPELADVLRALGASLLDVLLKVGIPHSLPYFFASLKVAITLAFVGSVLSETVAANEGIGYLMISAAAQVRMPLMFAGLVVVSAMAILMYALFALLERRMAGWAMRGTNVSP
jgi:NitT/TauT family transport system permease protein